MHNKRVSSIQHSLPSHNSCALEQLTERTEFTETMVASYILYWISTHRTTLYNKDQQLLCINRFLQSFFYSQIFCQENVRGSASTQHQYLYSESGLLFLMFSARWLEVFFLLLQRFLIGMPDFGYRRPMHLFI